MMVFLHGRFIPETEAAISIFDRSFMYGDGLFETIRVRGGKFFRWEPHFDRLNRGADFLSIRMPFTSPELARFAGELVAINGSTEAVLRIQMSRGPGVRGYSPVGADRPVLVMSLHPLPELPRTPAQSRLITSVLRVSAADPLLSFKTCSKLHHVLARAEAHRSGADDALLLNTSGELAEATGSNLFWITGGTPHTTPLASGALPGVTRAVLIELCSKSGTPVREKTGSVELLRRSEAVFLSLSSSGLVEVTELDRKPLMRSPVVKELYHDYLSTVMRETV
jgi:branched-chain amino acid aminotransferase